MTRIYRGPDALSDDLISYVVWDPAVHVGEWSSYRPMDGKFKVTASVAG
jgi:hypothetical protein